MIWRTLRRERLRSVLVLVLAGVPAILIGIGALIVPSVRAADRDFTKRDYGRTTLSLDVDQSHSADSAVKAVEKLLPAGSSVLLRQQSYLDVDADGRKTNARVVQEPFTDPLLAGVLHLESGRLPSATGEVALSPGAAKHLRLHVGSTVEAFRVVGIAREPNQWTTDGVYAAPGTFPRLGQVELLVTTADPRGLLALDTSTDGSLVTSVVVHDATGISGGRLDVSQNESALTIGLAAVLVLALGSLLVSSALHVTASRAILDLRLLHEAGATRGQITGLLVRQGICLGLVGGLVGVVIGIPVGTALLGPAQSVVDRQLTTSGVSVGLVALALVLALSASALGALFAAPATVREVSRGKTPVEAAPGVAAGRTVAGVVVAAGSFALFHVAATADRSGAASSADRRTQAVLLASLAMIAALVLLSPGVALLWDLAVRRLSPVARMSGREVRRRAGRHRLAAATVAVALGALSLAATALAGSHAHSVAQARRTLPADVLTLSGQDATTTISASATAGLPVAATAAQLSTDSVGVGYTRTGDATVTYAIVVVDSPGLLDVLRVDDPAAVRAALAQGKVVVNSRAVVQPEVTHGGDGSSPITDVAHASWPHGDDLPDVIAPTSYASADQGYSSTLVRLSRPVTRADLALLQRRAPDVSVGAALLYAPKASENAGILAALSSAALLTTVLVGLASTALAAVDARSDTLLLHQVGARRRDHRRLRAWRAATISGQGALAGAVLGTVAGLVTSDGARDPLTLSLVALLCVVGAPLVLAALAWVAPVRIRRTA